MYQLCPSILAADFNRLGEQIQALEKAGVKMLHIDVMDGNFVPNISFGMPLVESIRKETELFFDCHLMVQDPERYIEAFAACGADSITIHAEACKDLRSAIAAIHAAGCKAGLALKPATQIREVRSLLKELDLLLVMTVEPGFGAQKYITSSTEKICDLREIIENEKLSLNIQVDGGINDVTLETVMRAGANYLVMGSGVFRGDLEKNTKRLLAKIEEIGKTLR